VFSVPGLTYYAVYVLHGPVLHLSHGLFVKLAGADTSRFAPWAGFVFLGALLALCWALDRFYDTPFRAWLNSRIRTPVASDRTLAAPTAP